jgi:hypothetical protein
MLLVLLALCGLFSILTIAEQTPYRTRGGR